MSGFVSQDSTRAILSGGSLARVPQDSVRVLLAGGSQARVSQDFQLLVIQNASLAQVAQELLLVAMTNSCVAVTVTGHFTDAANNPIAGGMIEVQLNVDARTCNSLNVAAKPAVLAILDANGNIPPNTYMWSNSNLTSDGANNPTIYHIRLYNAQGLLVWSNDNATIPSPLGNGTFDLSNLTPF